VQRIDQALELRKVPRPPLVRVRYSDASDPVRDFDLSRPATPVAIKRVYAIGHVEHSEGFRLAAHSRLTRELGLTARSGLKERWMPPREIILMQHAEKPADR